MADTTPGTPPGGAPPSAPDSAALIAGKYKSVDELVSAHENLQRTLGQQSQELGVLRKQKPPEWGEADGVDAVLSKVGLKPEDARKHWGEKKALPDEARAKLKELGLPVKAVDDLLGAQAIAAEAKASRDELGLLLAQQRAGGAEKWQTISAWAATKLTPEQQNAINAKLARTSTMSEGLDELIGLYDKATGAPTGGLVGVTGGSAAPATEGFQSTRDITNYRAELRKRGIIPESDPVYMARLQKTPEWVVRGGAPR